MTSRVYASRPWLALYEEGQPADITPEHATVLEMFEASLAAAPQTEAIRYFDGVLTFADLDAASDALAVGLAEAGFAPGDRMGLYVQNDPAFVIGLLGAWKAGGAAVAINPMNKARELTYLLTDSGATRPPRTSWSSWRPTAAGRRLRRRSRATTWPSSSTRPGRPDPRRAR